MNKSFIRYIILSVLGIEAIFLLICAFVGLLYGEKQAIIYFICGLIYGCFGLINLKFKPKDYSLSAKDGFICVALAWITLSLFGTIPIYLTKDIPNFVDALFEIVSGFTTTGSSVLNNIESLSRTSLFWRSFTHWLGGMGVLCLILSILPVNNGYGIHLLRAESTGPSVSKIVSRLSSTAKILYSLYIMLTLLMVIVLLTLGVNVYESFTLAFATAGTGGFSIYGDSVAKYSMIVKNTIGVFCLLFGVSFNIYYLLLIGKVKEALKSEELRVYLGIIILSTLIIFINIYHTYSNMSLAFTDSFFQVSSIMTSTGFASCDFDLWPSLSKTILLSLMFVGACAGSTGGGLKVSRVIILIKDAFNNLIHNISPRSIKQVKMDGKSIDDEQLNSVKSYFSIFAIVFIISLLLISLNGFDFTTNFTSVLTTINNIGPGLNKIGPTCTFSEFSVLSKFVFMFDMLAGRLEFLPMLSLFTIFSTHKKTKQIHNE